MSLSKVLNSPTVSGHLEGHSMHPLTQKTHTCECLSPQETHNIPSVSITGVKEYIERSMHSVHYCFWQQESTLTGKSLWDGCVECYLMLYKVVNSSVKVYYHYRKKKIYSSLLLENHLVVVKIENSYFFHSFSRFLPVFFRPYPSLPLSFFSISVAPSISLNPHRHLCNNNGTPVGVWLVSLWQ